MRLFSSSSPSVCASAASSCHSTGEARRISFGYLASHCSRQATAASGATDLAVPFVGARARAFPLRLLIQILIPDPDPDPARAREAGAFRESSGNFPESSGILARSSANH